MKSTIPRVKLFFVGLFALSCAAIWAYQIFYVWPRDQCEGHGGWWEPKERICATPIAISSITGRPNRPAKTAPAPKASPVQAPSRVAPGIQSTSPAP
jgi:hypothetical protein